MASALDSDHWVPACLAYANEYAKHLWSQTACGEFPHCRQNTIQVAEDIPEEKYSFMPDERARSVEQALTHIAVSTRMWQEAHALGTRNMYDYDWANAFIELDSEEKEKRSKKELVDLLQNEGERSLRFSQDCRMTSWLNRLPKIPTSRPSPGSRA